MTGFSLGDIISGSGKGDNESGSLFAKKETKAAPAYDYSRVPARTKTAANTKTAEETEMDERTRLRKQKKQEKKKRKALELDAVKQRQKRTKFNVTPIESTGANTMENGAEDAEEAVEPKPAKVQQEDDRKTIIDPEKEKRTVFVGNIPVGVKESALKKLFGAHGSVECVRFRSAARPDLKTTKKVAVIKNMYHEERNNINAYIRFSSEEEASQSCQLNNTDLKGHTLRVDMSLNSKVHEQNRAIFLGNLSFKTHEDDLRKAFQRCGEIDNVRLVRDSSTGIGRGFGYINFVSKDSVETALKLDGTEVCGRKVRVSRSSRKPKVNQGGGGGPKRFQLRGEDSGNPTFRSKFEDRKKKLHSKNQNKVWKKNKGKKEEKRNSFQGVSSTEDGKTAGGGGKLLLNKQELKKKYIAKKLMG